MDVVTLLPSATEIVCALGEEPVATSHECDYPPRVRSLPDVTRARIDDGGSSESIHEAVARAEDGAGVFDVRTDVLCDADPDLVITQGVCDVCAVDRVLVEEVLAAEGLDADVVTTDPHSLSDLYDDVLAIGEALDRSDRATAFVDDLRERVAAVRADVDVEHFEERPTVAVLDWLDPVMVAGHWMPEIVEYAGGRYPMAETGDRSRPREWEELVEMDPDVLVLAPCGFDLEQAIENIEEVRSRPGWEELTAVRDERVYLLDGHHYVNRPGPRLVDTLEFVAGVVHPTTRESPPASVARPLSEVLEERSQRPASE